MLATLTPLQLEALESRLLLHGGLGGEGFGIGSTIEFSQAPALVQTGLDKLAAEDNLAAPSSTQSVQLGNTDGVETYSIEISTTGTQSVLTVNQNGNPITRPTHTTTTFASLPSAAATEINAIASALSLTAPTSTATVNVSTPAGGIATYTIRLASSITGTRGRVVSVDANGVPNGNQTLPFSVLPAAIQGGLNTNRPSGAAELAASSTQNVIIRTPDGITSYSTAFTVSGTTTTVTVNATGQLTTLPSHTGTEFQDIPSATQTELQMLASADGVSGAISSTQMVQEYNEANGTTIYSVTLQASRTGAGSSKTYTINLTISADEDGNPTVPPDQGLGDFGFGFGGFIGHGGGGGFFGIHGSAINPGGLRLRR